MFNRILVYFVIPLIFSVCLSISPVNYRFGAYPIQLCSENATFSGYCIDCETELDCHSGANSTTHICTQEQACQVSKTFAACTPINNVLDCSCPPDQNIKKPDPYDETKYLLCNEGSRYIFSCPEGERFNPDTQDCYVPPTTTSTTTTENPCPDAGGNIVIKLNCTCSRYCFVSSNSYLDECCNAGEIYDEVTDSCQFYYPFSCTGREDGEYVDTHNCSIYHICVDEEIFATDACLNQEEFDEAIQSCTTEDTTCNAIEDCGICPDEDTFIKIDCLNYYDCVKNEDDSAFPPFVPELQTCPVGTCFSAETTFCDVA